MSKEVQAGPEAEERAHKNTITQRERWDGGPMNKSNPNIKKEETDNVFTSRRVQTE